MMMLAGALLLAAITAAPPALARYAPAPLQPACDAPLAGVSIRGPTIGTVGEELDFSARLAPLDATAPISYTWSPEPFSGQGTAIATYRWTDVGRYTVSVEAENCGGAATAAQEVDLSTGLGPDLRLAVDAPAVAVAGQPFAVTVELRNVGATAAEGLTVNAPLPAGATYVAGGTRDDTGVVWSLPRLEGLGATAAFSYTMAAGADIRPPAPRARSIGGQNAIAASPLTTTIVTALVPLVPGAPGELATEDAALSAPAGAVITDTLLTYTVLEASSRPLPATVASAGPRFRLAAYRGRTPIPDLRLAGETTLRFPGASAAAALYALTDDGWQPLGACAPASGGVECRLRDAPMGEYAVLAPAEGEQQRLYLPLLLQ